MPEQDLPMRWRISLRVAGSLFYLLVVAVGLSGLLLTPKTIEGTAGAWMTYWWAGITLVGGVMAFVGCSLDRYRIEWVAAWPVAGGTLMYAFMVWLMVFADGVPTRAAQAFALTALGLAMMRRGFYLAAYASKRRREHEAAADRSGDVVG